MGEISLLEKLDAMRDVWTLEYKILMESWVVRVMGSAFPYLF